jgi:hypothetical protein
MRNDVRIAWTKSASKSPSTSNLSREPFADSSWIVAKVQALQLQLIENEGVWCQRRE